LVLVVAGGSPKMALWGGVSGALEGELVPLEAALLLEFEEFSL